MLKISVPLITCWLAIGCFLTAADRARAKDITAKESEQEILNHARKAGPEGSSAYFKALSDAIKKRANLMRAKDGTGYTSTMRSLATSTTKRSIKKEPATQELLVFQDKRYQNWLLETVKKPVIEIGKVKGKRISMRSLGSEEVADTPQFRDFFKEVGIATRKNRGFCSGVLIDRRVVLSAAHCMCKKKPRFKFGNDPDHTKQVYRVLGSKGAITVSCKKSGKLTKKSQDDLKGNDIAVFVLHEEVAPFIAKTIPRQRMGVLKTLKGLKEKGDNSMVVVGYGKTGSGNIQRKNFVRVPILSADCSGRVSKTETDEDFYGCQKGTEILSTDRRDPPTGKPGGQSASSGGKLIGPCGGDSGGAAFVMLDQKKNGKILKIKQLVGVVSRSVNRPPAKHRCGDGAIYTLLTKKRIDWVFNTAAALKAQFPEE